MTEADAPEPRRTAETSRAWRVFLIPALCALVGYIVLYALDDRLRNRRGPWEVTFLTEADGTPAVVLAQPALQIRDVRIRFVGEHLEPGTNPPALPATVSFGEPQARVPFGRTAFDDLMYLPGTVVLHCFGHEVQMLPRTLYLNRAGNPWSNGRTYDLVATGKLASLEPPARLKALRDGPPAPPR